MYTFFVSSRRVSLSVFGPPALEEAGLGGVPPKPPGSAPFDI